MKPNNTLAVDPWSANGNRDRILGQLNHKTSRQTFLARNIQSQDLAVIKILRSYSRWG
jgi:hypothetical protein